MASFANRQASATFLAPIILLLLLAGCDFDDGEKQIARMKAERLRGDSPALWSISVVGEANNGRPILICANSRIVSGFAVISPRSAGKLCARESADGEIIPTEHGSRYRCHLNGAVYAVSSGIVGDQARDFFVSSSIHPLSSDGPDYARDMRFRRIGACPHGWNVGEATNQKGAKTLAFDPSQN